MIDFVKRPNFSGTRTFFWRLVHSRLFWKYVVLFVAVMGSALVTNSLVDIWFTYQQHRTVLIRAQNEQAGAAAAKISQGHLGLTTHLSWTVPAMEQRELDGIRLLRQVPAITELSLLDDQGREQLRLSRQAMDRVGGNTDFSADERFKEAVANKVYYGPVNFRHGTEPFMTLAIAGARRDAHSCTVRTPRRRCQRGRGESHVHLGCRQSDPCRPNRQSLRGGRPRPAYRSSRHQSRSAQHRPVTACASAVGADGSRGCEQTGCHGI